MEKLNTPTYEERLAKLAGMLVTEERFGHPEPEGELAEVILLHDGVGIPPRPNRPRAV